MFARDKTFNFSTCGCFSFPVCSITDQKSIWAAWNSWRMTKVSATYLPAYQQSRAREQISSMFSGSDEKFSRFVRRHTISRADLSDKTRYKLLKLVRRLITQLRWSSRQQLYSLFTLTSWLETVFKEAARD
jgi:hypothetical protein